MNDLIATGTGGILIDRMNPASTDRTAHRLYLSVVRERKAHRLYASVVRGKKREV